MVDDREVWACALAVERRYRDRAAHHVAERIGALASAGDAAGLGCWRRIAAALDQLSRPGSSGRPT